MTNLGWTVSFTHVAKTSENIYYLSSEDKSDLISIKITDLQSKDFGKYEKVAENVEDMIVEASDRMILLHSSGKVQWYGKTIQLPEYGKDRQFCWCSMVQVGQKIVVVGDIKAYGNEEEAAVFHLVDYNGEISDQVRTAIQRTKHKNLGGK